jgi:hypothetical protein
MAISRAALYRELSAGRLTAVKVCGRTLISRVEQDRWFAALPKADLAQPAS